MESAISFSVRSWAVAAQCLSETALGLRRHRRAVVNPGVTTALGMLVGSSSAATAVPVCSGAVGVGGHRWSIAWPCEMLNIYVYSTEISLETQSCRSTFRYLFVATFFRKASFLVPSPQGANPNGTMHLSESERGEVWRQL
ncbi:hypothetical protein TNCV_2504171 [Trichonephila clavipes]|nr:hypothetical protein TNCV_2504171 [Trichonephila clavipes]